MDLDAFEEFARYLHTCAIGKVSSYDATNQTVDVQLLTKRTFMGTDTLVSRKVDVLNDVPLATFRNARSGVYFDVQAGDLVLVMFAMHSIAEIVTSNGECGVVQPALVGTHDLADGLAIPISFGTRPATSTGAATEVIGDNVRLGRPNEADRVILSGLINVLQDLVGDLNSNIDAVATAAGTTVTPVVLGSIPLSEQVRVS